MSDNNNITSSITFKVHEYRIINNKYLRLEKIFETYIQIVYNIQTDYLKHIPVHINNLSKTDLFVSKQSISTVVKKFLKRIKDVTQQIIF